MAGRADPRDQFLMGTEQECLTAVAGTDEPRVWRKGIRLFLTRLARAAPSLPATSGFFNGYGRVYLDCGDHIELAVAECDSPYQVPMLLERQQHLAGDVVSRLEEEAGVSFLLLNNNHTSLLDERDPAWGSHENYLVERNPREFGEAILPFLVTRLYAGAGGIHYPSGDFLATVRSQFMERATGGGTTRNRAIHSTAREEPLMGSSSTRHRYHLISADGHRSHFNLALQLGATALAIKAALYDDELRRELTRFRLPRRRSWVKTLEELNVLARRGAPLRVPPLALEVQRTYLAAATRFAGTLDAPAPWIPVLLADWEATLGAMECHDRAWLAARLDTFAKYELYSGYLGEDWDELARDPRLFYELALLDHDYHEFCNPESPFEKLARQGVITHRVADRIEPGAEAEPYVPETRTRARTRARFIRDHAWSKDFIVDWDRVYDIAGNRVRLLSDPFQDAYAEPKATRGVFRDHHTMELLRRLSDSE